METSLAFCLSDGVLTLSRWLTVFPRLSFVFEELNLPPGRKVNHLLCVLSIGMFAFPHGVAFL